MRDSLDEALLRQMEKSILLDTVYDERRISDINLDHLLYYLKLISKLPNDKEKGKVYEELFQKNTGQADLEQVNKLLKYFESTEKTNMNIFVEKCLESLQTFK